MTISQLRKEIADLKKTLNPDNDIGVMIHYRGELKDENGNYLYESIIAIDGWDASELSNEQIQAIIDNAKILFLMPDNGRDPDMWKVRTHRSGHIHKYGRTHRFH